MCVCVWNSSIFVFLFFFGSHSGNEYESKFHVFEVSTSGSCRGLCGFQLLLKKKLFQNICVFGKWENDASDPFADANLKQNANARYLLWFENLVFELQSRCLFDSFYSCNDDNYSSVVAISHFDDNKSHFTDSMRILCAFILLFFSFNSDFILILLNEIVKKRNKQNICHKTKLESNNLSICSISYKMAVFYGFTMIFYSVELFFHFFFQFEIEYIYKIHIYDFQLLELSEKCRKVELLPS